MLNKWISKKLGMALFVLYFAQLTLGAGIHYIKPRWSTGRPPQNYAHALIGLLIIGLSFWQVGTGYATEYPESTGKIAPEGVAVMWIVWVTVSLHSYLHAGDAN